MALLINDEYVADSVIRQEADLVRAKLAETGDYDDISLGIEAWELARESVIAMVLLRQAASNGREPRKITQPTKQEIAAFYNRNRDRFYAPEMIHASHIVKNTDERVNEADAFASITAIAHDLRAGRSFDDLADQRSDCPGRGGDLGWFPRGEMVEEFDAIVFLLKAGDTSPIFRSPFGFHIARVHDRKPEGIRPLNDVRDAISLAIHRDRSEEAIARFVAELRSRARIERVK